jgi:hypothetical protein
MNIALRTTMAGALLVAGAATPALAGHDDWRDRRTASPHEVQRSWERVQDERRDVVRAQWRGDPRDVREEVRELQRAQAEFRRDRADLYRAGWDDDRRGRNNNGNGWGRGGRRSGWRENDYGWQRDGWNRQGWHAEQFYVDDGRYRPRTLGYNDQVWRGYDNRYYCRRSDGTTGLIIGGLAGGTLGNVVAPGGSKLLGSIIGGTLGAVIGNSVDRNRVVCR